MGLILCPTLLLMTTLLSLYNTISFSSADLPLVLPGLAYLLAPLTLTTFASSLAASACMLVLLATSLTNSDMTDLALATALTLARLSGSLWSVGLSYGLMAGANLMIISGEDVIGRIRILFSTN